MSTSYGDNCSNIEIKKNYPIATLLPINCPLPTPSFNNKYIRRDSIAEVPFVDVNFFVPVKTPTPTPSITPTISLTPSVTPSNTPTPPPTPVGTHTPTPTVTPTITPTPTHQPSYRFELLVSAVVYTEAQFLISLADGTIYMYHAVEGTFPLNPVSLQWRTFVDGVVAPGASYSANWNIPWKLTYGAAPRFSIKSISPSAIATVAGIAGLIYAGYIAGSVILAGTTAAGVVVGSLSIAAAVVSVGAAIGSGLAAVGVGVAAAQAIGLVLAATGIGLVIGGLAYGLFKLFGFGKKPKPPEPKAYPQFSDKFSLKPVVIPISDKFTLMNGIIPDHVTDGGISVEFPPSKETAFMAAIKLVDNSPGAINTADPWQFKIVIES